MFAKLTRGRFAAASVAVALVGGSLALVQPVGAAGLPSGCSATTTLVTCTGTFDHSNWIIEKPAAGWNGTLLLYSHGFRPATSGNHSAQDAPTGVYGPYAKSALLAQGYALAGSSYARNGAAVADGVQADLQLLTIFRQKIGTPARTYAWGESMGGLITELLAERYPSLVSGAAPLCGVLSGLLPVSDAFLDAAVAAKVFFYPKLKLLGYATNAEAANNFAAVEKAVSAQLSDPATAAPTLGRLIGVDALLGLPLQTRFFNGVSQTSLAKAAAESFLTQVGYAILGSRDVVSRAGGNPVTNVGVDYRRYVTTAATARFTAYGFSKYLLSAYATTLNTRAARVAAVPAARARIAALTPSGFLRRATLTMHTEFDPLVTASNEALFGRRVAAQRRTGLLVQTYIAPPAYGDVVTDANGGYVSGAAPYGAGHCNFSAQQYVAVVTTLDRWVRSHVRPVGAAVSNVFTAVGAAGLDPAFAPLGWPRPGVR